jgi:hypothetical protein
VPFAAFVVTSIFAVFLFVWLYDHTRGSLLIATLFHASMNAWSNILPFPSTSESFFWLLGVAQLVAIVAIVLVGGTDWIKHYGLWRGTSAPATPSAKAASLAQP